MNMLQEFLNLGLVDIGSDDSRFAKMESASTELSKQFAESLPLMITATLVALDENINEDDPFFELVEGLVIEKWKTLRNTHVNRPRELLRSIAVSALFEASNESPERSAIVWNTAASRLHHGQSSLGKAAKLLRQSLEKTFSAAEEESLQRAGMIFVAHKTTRPQSQSVEAPATPGFTGKIDRNEILNDVARAAGPQYPRGQALQNANPHWPNSPQHWSDEFAPRMADALVKSVNLGTSRLAESIATDLAKYTAVVEDRVEQQLRHLESLQSNLTESKVAGQMRLDVLWWSQARYSPSQEVAYSTLAPGAAALAAAADLTRMVPALAPASVAHVLGETMAACLKRERRCVMDLLETLRDSPPRNLEGYFPEGDTNAVRVPLLELAIEVADGRSVSKDDVKSRAGVDPDLTLDPADMAMWLFRELQALRIAGGIA